MRVINVNRTCILCDVENSKIIKWDDHVALDGIENYKLGIFVERTVNLLASYLITMLRTKYVFHEQESVRVV